ncbi:MAG: hypothetical protein PUP91_16785 [Rhizonema sp. PD37]|nr:hypothetical protein [Rhizonema sp. PD37]
MTVSTPKILLVTVGGSFQPIVTSIHSLKPDRVIFLASDGEKGSKSQVISNPVASEQLKNRRDSRIQEQEK